MVWDRELLKKLGGVTTMTTKMTPSNGSRRVKRRKTKEGCADDKMYPKAGKIVKVYPDERLVLGRAYITHNADGAADPTLIRLDRRARRSRSDSLSGMPSADRRLLVQLQS